jgi:cell division protein FtsQ
MPLIRGSAPPSTRRFQRYVLALAALAAVLAVAYLLWLRDSSLVAVERTTVTGLSTDQAGEIRAALKRAAREMTSLNVDSTALEEAVERYPEVAGVEADPTFPHELHIEVTERTPVASISPVGGDSVAVAADGTLIEAGKTADPLPELVGIEPPASGALRDRPAVAAVKVVAALPEVLSARVTTLEERPGEGFVATVAGGPEVVLGDLDQLEDKWLAAAAAIADGGADEASYVDVSVPERPALGAEEQPSTSG